jgi:hypothetical protein
LTPHTGTNKIGKKGIEKHKDSKKKERRDKEKERIKEEDKPLEETNNKVKEDVERLSKKRFTYFKTQKMPWSPIIQFPDPALEISAPELITIRDTLRSKVNVKVISMKVCLLLTSLTWCTILNCS